MGLEFLVCLLLAALFTGGRFVQDTIATAKGTTPPHVERARIRAEGRARAREAAKPEKERSPYAAGKPGLKDVAAVYWGDALQDVIDAHEQRRAEKKAQRQENQAAKAENRPARHFRPSLAERVERLAKLLWEGPQRPAEDELVPSVDEVLIAEPAAGADTSPPPGGPGGSRVLMRWDCERCGTGCGGYDSDDAAAQDAQLHLNKVHGGCGKVVAGRIEFLPGDPDGESPARHCDTCGTTVGMTRNVTRCIPCIAINATREQPHGTRPTRHTQGHWGNGTFVRASARDSQTGDAYNWACQHCGQTTRREFPSPAAADADYYSTHMPCPIAGDLKPGSGGLCFFTCGQCGFDSGQIYPDQDAAHAALKAHRCSNPNNQEDAMTTPATSGSATGDAHDLESASNECDLLDGDLTAVDTALDLIDERITSAGAAAERLKGFLDSKSMPDSITAGMATALEMLSPEHIKALIDAIAAAKTGVRASKEAIDTMNEQATEALQGADGSAVNGR
ncbi:hypothetical protein ACWT_5828 [Actinoplanes sp. SE50]|uniref:hypothetical protein n=1 Tax=unclassified Actinoplanes TaxID=2626549 RepID=UPI00023EBC1F|nr:MULTISPECIES: hypothetical protein [unclassified Actinoplanes]AEV86846.1 hypothetical protein ACPL_5959 [Actinoplanes sp. SE50/110]ATO85243.1 hypothetical protein ACWT_5828 [Actinoplanes sp. SE50]SLM02653.1 hypothetical protein ACSP50_5935 [Actinoplanes sp. SE50/110]